MSKCPSLSDSNTHNLREKRNLRALDLAQHIDKTLFFILLVNQLRNGLTQRVRERRRAQPRHLPMVNQVRPFLTIRKEVESTTMGAVAKAGHQWIRIRGRSCIALVGAGSGRGAAA
jgi:hypothetical protein